MIALYAFDHELARAPRASTNPLIGEMRLAFWDEALDEMFEGRPVRAHPTAQALAAAVGRHALPRAPLQAMLDARDRELDRKPLTAEEARVLAASTGGEAAGLAARMLAPETPTSHVLVQGARWALSRLLLAARIAEPELPAVRTQLNGRGRASPLAAAFPAAAHAALVRPYTAGRRPSELEKRLRITWAVARGRV